MSDTTEQIKERLGIVDVVSAYIKIEKSGSNFKARCPFHHEKTPSFFISPTRNTYYCFGCGEKGDIFSFVERFEGVDFPGALKQLAEKAGVPIVYESREKSETRTSLYEILEASTEFYEKNFKENEAAKKYLADRGLTQEFMDRFRIGFSLNEWNSLYDYLKERGHEDDDIEKAGLIKKGDRGFYDRFRSRIMFPLADTSGRVIAYSGRIFPDDKETAKYINSPETGLYNKSKVLYGLDKAKLLIRKSNFSIVVEGQMDVVMSHQAGYGNTVALSGTALTEAQITQLQRLSNNIVFALDSDAAGIASSGRSADMALAAGMDVKVAKLPEGVDPADLVKDNPENLKKAVRNSVHIIDFYLETIAKGESDKRKLNKKVEEQVLPFIARIPSRIDQMHFVGEVARRLGVPEDVIRDEVVLLASKNTAEEIPTQGDMVTKEKTALSKREVIQNKLFGILFSEREQESPDIDISKLETDLKNIIGEESFKELEKNPQNFEEETLFAVEIGYTTPQKLLTEVEALKHELEREHIQDKLDDVLMRLREAEGEKNQESITKCLEKIKKYSLEIEDIKSRKVEEEKI